MHVDGFRFDLAPDARPGAMAASTRLAAVLRSRRSGSGGLTGKLIAEPWDVGQPDSYDVGRFPRRGAEWNGKYRDSVRDFWRSRQHGLPRFRHPVRRVAPTCTAAPAEPDRLDQLRHRARRLHPARPGLLRPQAQRGQRREQPRRHRRQPLVELRRRGTRRRPGHPGAAGPPVPRAAHHPAAVAAACRCCWAATSSAAPSRATTTPTARTMRSPGSTGRPSTAELLGFTRRLIALRRTHPVFRRRRFLAGAEHRAALVHARRAPR